MTTNLNLLIKKSGYKKEKIAEFLDVSIWTITNWCKGYTSPTLEQAQKLKEVLNLQSIDELVKENE
jgi:DNA-binding XRE family transcriptional regulator